MSRRNSCDALNRLSATDSQAGGIQRQWNYSYDRTNRTKCQVIRKKCRREVILSGARLTGTSLRSSTNTLLNYHGYGYNLAAQRTNQARTDASTVAYTRGNDLSGSLEGAGGIGGLLARSHGYNSGNWNTNNFYHADGNGNVTFMLSSAQAMVAQYRYDAYGNLLSSAGSLASANVYRFSSKEFHSPSGLYYYGFRFYDPANQRWLNRDPLGEEGGLTLYNYVGNNPVNWIDPDGESAVPLPVPTWVWPKSPNPVNCAFTAGAVLGAGLCIAFPDTMTKPGEWIGNWIGNWNCPMSQSHGERKITRRPENPWKGWHEDPNDPNKGWRRHPQTGKKIPAPRPPGPKPE
jgi:RHS repeat-associated protein